MGDSERTLARVLRNTAIAYRLGTSVSHFEKKYKATDDPVDPFWGIIAALINLSFFRVIESTLIEEQENIKE